MIHGYDECIKVYILHFYIHINYILTFHICIKSGRYFTYSGILEAMNYINVLLSLYLSEDTLNKDLLKFDCL